MIRWLIDEVQIEHFMAEVDSLNEPSLRLLERLGFRRAIVARRTADHFKGRSSDEWTWRLTAADFVRSGASERLSR